jgi:hypothetical protein
MEYLKYIVLICGPGYSSEQYLELLADLVKTFPMIVEDLALEPLMLEQPTEAIFTTLLDATFRRNISPSMAFTYVCDLLVLIRIALEMGQDEKKLVQLIKHYDPSLWAGQLLSTSKEYKAEWRNGEKFDH